MVTDKNIQRFRTAAVVLIAVIISICCASQAFASVDYMPGVTKEMTYPGYWADKLEEPDKVIADLPQIDAINNELNSKLNNGSFRKYDLKNWNETVEKVSLTDSMLNSLCADAAYNYVIDGAKVTKTAEGKYISCSDPPEAWSKIYKDAVINSIDPEVKEYFGGDDLSETEQKALDCCRKWCEYYVNGGDKPEAVKFVTGEGSLSKGIGYAVCTKRSALQGYPTYNEILDEKWTDTSGDSNFDYKYHTSVRVNEPMVTLMKSLDGKFYLVRTSCMSGWIPASDIAVCSDRNEWLQSFDFGSDESLIVYGDKIYTETSKTDPETSQVQLTLGTKLRLAAKTEYSGLVTNRATYNNYVVWLPVRNSDGTYKRVLALISENRKVCEGYLPLTYRNIYKAALGVLGDAYGWGGSLDSNDCSGLYRDLFACFGLDLTRNVTSGERSVVKNYDLSGMTDAEKADLIKTLPPGTELNMPSHETIYLGYEGDSIFVISSSSRIRQSGVDQSRSRGCIINDITSAGGTTWLSQMNNATVPFYLHNDNMPEVRYKPAAPAAPVISSSVNVSGKSVSIRWAADANADEYRAAYREVGADSWNRKWADSRTSCTVKGLKKGGLYDFRVNAVKEDGNRLIYSEDSNISHSYINTVSGVKVKAGRNSVTVSWKADKKASGFIIRCSAKKNMKNAVTVTAEAGKTSCTIKKLKKNKKYYVRVMPVASAGGEFYNGAWSNRKAVRTK